MHSQVSSSNSKSHRFVTSRKDRVYPFLINKIMPSFKCLTQFTNAFNTVPGFMKYIWNIFLTKNTCHFSSTKKITLNIYFFTQRQIKLLHTYSLELAIKICAPCSGLRILTVMCLTTPTNSLGIIFPVLFPFQQLFSHHAASFLSSANLCKRWRAFSCFLSSFLDLEATFRANSLCFSSLSLC